MGKKYQVQQKKVIAVADWQCTECHLVLDAEDEGQTESCPLCGREMISVIVEET